MSLPPSFLQPGYPWHLVASRQILGGETGGELKEGKERQGLDPSPGGLATCCGGAQSREIMEGGVGGTSSTCPARAAGC